MTSETTATATPDLEERLARAICEADGVDPDMPCPGIGHRVPVGETWPAWRVRLPQAQAALAVMSDEIGRLGERVVELETRRPPFTGSAWDK